MLGRMLEKIAQWLKRVVTQPREELDRWQQTARFAYDLGRFGARQLQHDRAQQMAAALAFRTLFGLLPVLVLGTILVKAMGLEDNFLEPLSRLFEFWGLNEVQILVPAGGGEPSMTLADWLGARVREVERMNWAAIGWIGVGVTLYAAIGLMVTIENSFNIIFRAHRGRNWVLRVPLYWFALTLSPVAIVGSSYISGYIGSWMNMLEGRVWLSAAAGLLWSTFSIWVIMVFVYVILPNTHVRVRHAAAGALVAAILLEIGKRTMGAYLSQALSVSQLYGSLGLVPLFMFWVYLMWIAVLFGLQVSATLQFLRGRMLAELERQQTESAFVEATIVVQAMQRVAERFVAGKATTIDRLVRELRIGEGVVERIVRRLTDAGLLHRVGDESLQVTVARPLAGIRIARLLDIGFELAQDGNPESGEALEAELERLRDAQRKAAADTTLDQLIREQ